MATNYVSKNKNIGVALKKKHATWNQRLPKEFPNKPKNLRTKKSLQYILILKKFENLINFKNIRLLKVFLTVNGKIRPRRKTRVSTQQQRLIAKSIKKARSVGLIPYTCSVKI